MISQYRKKVIMKNKKILILFIIILGILLIIASKTSIKEKNSNKEILLGIDYNIKGNESKLNYDTNNPVVAMYIKKYGSIVMELYPNIAPNTVNNFISLIKNGFYDNNSFHRLVPGFVLQGGDPNGTGSGGPGYTIKGEFKENGFNNELSHEKGVISMARSQENDSAGSQFFICLEDAKSLDGSYATFGKIIDGFDILEEIEKKEQVSDSASGKLQNNLVIKKAIIDLKGKNYSEVEKITN